MCAGERCDAVKHLRLYAYWRIIRVRLVCVCVSALGLYNIIIIIGSYYCVRRRY